MNFLSMCVASISMLIMASFETVAKVIDVTLSIIASTGIFAFFSWFVSSGACQEIINALVG